MKDYWVRTLIQPNMPVRPSGLIESERHEYIQIAERTYHDKHGPRNKYIHLDTHMMFSGDILMGPRMWYYIERYPCNICCFYSVDLPTETAIFDGWLWHFEVKRRGEPFHFPGYESGWKVDLTYGMHKKLGMLEHYYTRGILRWKVEDSHD